MEQQWIETLIERKSLYLHSLFGSMSEKYLARQNGVPLAPHVENLPRIHILPCSPFTIGIGRYHKISVTYLVETRQPAIKFNNQFRLHQKNCSPKIMYAMHEMATDGNQLVNITTSAKVLLVISTLDCFTD